MNVCGSARSREKEQTPSSASRSDVRKLAANLQARGVTPMSTRKGLSGRRRRTNAKSALNPTVELQVADACRDKINAACRHLHYLQAGDPVGCRAVRPRPATSKTMQARLLWTERATESCVPALLNFSLGQRFVTGTHGVCVRTE